MSGNFTPGMRLRAGNGLRVGCADDLCDTWRLLLHDEQSLHALRLQYEALISKGNARTRKLFLHPSQPLEEVHAKALCSYDRGRVYALDVLFSVVPDLICGLLWNGRRSENMGRLSRRRPKDNFQDWACYLEDSREEVNGCGSWRNVYNLQVVSRRG